MRIKVKRLDNILKWGWLLAGFLLWSACMGEGGHSVRYSSRRAVVQEKPWKSLHVKDDAAPQGYLISSADFEQREDLKEGDCCVVEYKVDFSDQYKDGVYEAEIMRCELLPTAALSPVMTDTSAVLVNEQFADLAFNRSLYMKGRYFLDVKLKEYQPTREDLMELSYNPGQEAKTGENGIRVYDLYFRTWKDRQKDTLNVSTRMIPVAFVLDEFVERKGPVEKEAGAEELHFVINYPQRFNTDTTGCIWAATDTFSIRLD